MVRSLSVKLPLTFFILAIIPLIVISFIWYTTSQEELIKTTSYEVDSVASQATNEVGNFFTTKLISLIIHSQTQAFLSGDQAGVAAEMQNFFLQDKDIRKLVYVSSSGELLAETSLPGFTAPIASSEARLHPAFRITTFLGGSRYIGQVYGDKKNDPLVDIAVPVVLPQQAQNLQDLSTSAIGQPLPASSIRGVLIETVSLSSLWEQLNQMQIGVQGYVFVVDDRGTVLNHPNWQLIEQRVEPTAEIARFIESSGDPGHLNVEEVAVQNNEVGVPSLTTHGHADLPRWGIIAQIPLSEALQRTTNAAFFTSIVFIISAISIIFLSLFFASRIVAPIRKLAHGADVIGGGNFHERIILKTGDELEKLAESFNKMAVNLQSAFVHISDDKNVIASERNKLSIALSSISDGIVVLDLEGRIAVFNKAVEDITGYVSSEVVGKKLEDLVIVVEGATTLPGNVYAPVLKEQFEGIVFASQKAKLQGKEQKEATVNITTAQILEGSTTNVGNILIIHDVSKEAELEQMKLDFVSMAAHELRTPLTSIRGYLSVFLQDYRDSLNDDQKMFLSRVYISTHQLLALVENLLSVSKIERGDISLIRKPADWTPLVKKIVSEFHDRAAEKGLTLTFIEPQQGFPRVLVDHLRIAEVLSNLLSNAIAYTQKGGTVTVWVEQQGGMLVTNVRDTGSGIPKESLPKLFKKFFRVSAKLESGSKGTGLGLYISRSIIEMHRGKIWVESIPGEGSTFSFSVPIAEDYGGDIQKNPDR